MYNLILVPSFKPQDHFYINTTGAFTTRNEHVLQFHDEILLIISFSVIISMVKT